MEWTVHSEPQGDSAWYGILADGIEDWLRFDLEYNPMYTVWLKAFEVQR